MSAYDLHRDGDCWPDSCPLCAQETDGEFDDDGEGDQ